MSSDTKPRPGIRWWPAIAILALATVVIIGFRTIGDHPFQWRNMRMIGTGLIASGLLLLWWITCSRTHWQLRLGVFAAVLGVFGVLALTFRYKGVSGDLFPIFEPRWTRSAPAVSKPASAAAPVSTPAVRSRPDFPQFLGPKRTGVLEGPALDPDWAAHPPRVVWRQPVGSAWSGFAIVGERALTQEQQGDQELVTCRDLSTGLVLWTHADATRYETPIAGIGPRATPTVVSNRVYTLGGTGRLNCLELATGKPVWSRDLAADGDTKMPGWGFACSPLVLGDKLIVSSGGKGKSVIAYRADTGDIVWAAGDSGTSYASPLAAILAGIPHILMFNGGRITGHDAGSGAVLWEKSWGVGNPHVAMPVITGPDTVLFSAGYGAGAEVFRVVPGGPGKAGIESVWASKKMKAKFSNPVALDGFLYGLDDGILACVDLKDGLQRWKEGRYGHGQGLLVHDLLLLMSEGGELVLLKPTPQGAGELHRFRVFDGKTWNSIALAGDRLIVRTDLEAVCLELGVNLHFSPLE